MNRASTVEHSFRAPRSPCFESVWDSTNCRLDQQHSSNTQALRKESEGWGVMRQNAAAAWIVIVIVVVVEDVMSGCREARTELHGGRGRHLAQRGQEGRWDLELGRQLTHPGLCVARRCPALSVPAKRNIRLPD